MKQRLTYFFGLVAAVILLAFEAYRPDESTGVYAFDPAWLRDSFHEVHTAILGIIVASVVAWVLPMDWDRQEDRLPLAILYGAVILAVGQM